jgi:hypothetical protein
MHLVSMMRLRGKVVWWVPLRVPIDWNQVQPNRLAGVPQVRRQCQFVNTKDSYL